MLSFTDLLGSVRAAGDETTSVDVPEDWMQGRTVYGGLSAALALDAALRIAPDAGPLRSALVSFIGPADGGFEFQASVLRAGRSVRHVAVDGFSGGKIAIRCAFVFGAARPSIFDEHHAPAPAVRPPEECPPLLPRDQGPSFVRHYDARLAAGAGPVSGSEASDHLIWVRHRDAAATGLVALVALGDMPPPAMLARFPEPAPISSITWMLNILRAPEEREAEWRLMRTWAEDAREGYSSQDMAVWDKDGRPIATGRQSVALFL
ncbi:MAG: thioesterase family protein [Pseudomonadota bacterium]